LKAIWQAYDAKGVLDPGELARLDAIQQRDGIFPDIDPGLWATGAKAIPPKA
jgi:1,4-alpha-glucan branching enzyme